MPRPLRMRRRASERIARNLGEYPSRSRSMSSSSASGMIAATAFPLRVMITGALLLVLTYALNLAFTSATDAIFIGRFLASDEQPVPTFHADRQNLQVADFGIHRMEYAETIIWTEAEFPIGIELHLARERFAIASRHVRLKRQLLFDDLANQLVMLPLDRFKM